LAKDVPPDEVIPMLDRYLMFYIRTADRLQRTARWVEGLPGGIKYLREVIIEDKLGICSELEKQMQVLIGTFFCEWTEVIKSEEKKKMFQQFVNTGEQAEGVEIITERGQERPTNWPKESAKVDFRGTKWSSLAWQPMLDAKYFETASSANVKRGDTQLAIFKVKGKLYASQQMCPHKRAFVLSDGIIGDDDKGHIWVSCPNHKRNYDLNGADAGKCSNDADVNIAMFEVEERDDGLVYLKLPPVDELDSVLGTSKWIIKKEESEDPFVELDKLLVGRGSKKPSQMTSFKTKEIAVGNGGCGGGPGLDW